jgi:hypothetical protein
MAAVAVTPCRASGIPESKLDEDVERPPEF